MNFDNLKLFLDKMAAERTPGNAVIVYKDGEAVFRYAAGYANIEQGERYSTNHHIYVYSCTKVATVTAAAQLLEKGDIRLTDPLYAYIPEFREMLVKTSEGQLEKANKPITIEHLFTMTSGLNYDLNAPVFQQARASTCGKMDTLQSIRCVAELPLSFHPGEKWAYGISHDVLAAVVSVVSGKPFRDYMRENIFLPLNMERTSFHPTQDSASNMAVQYYFVPSDGKELDLVEAQKYGCAENGTFQPREGNRFVFGPEYDSGGAGIITTTEDFAKFAAALANYGLGMNGERILKPETVELIRTDRLTPAQRPYFDGTQHKGYGYGLGVRTHIDQAKSKERASLGNFGWSGAAGSHLTVDPSINMGVFYTQHCLNPRETFYQPKLLDVLYSCF